MTVGVQDQYRHTLQRALMEFGREKQTLVAIGEFGELLTAIANQARGRAEANEVIDEIADCFICLAQLTLIYGEHHVSERIAAKMIKLEGILKFATLKQTWRNQ